MKFYDRTSILSFKDGKWCLSKPIAGIGEFLQHGYGQGDLGSSTYVGGMAYYWGVGEADFNWWTDGITHSNRLYLARCDEKNWLLESYVSHDAGDSYCLEQVIRTIPKEKNIKIWRPTVPIRAQGNMPVYWHEGHYTSHTGGWDCDTVMLVEYDD